MPHDLFAAGAHDTRARARRSSVFLVSFAVHLAAVAAILLATLLLPAVLPRPHASIVYAVEGPRHVRLTDIALAPRAARPSSAAAPVAASAPVPVDAPPTITDEPPVREAFGPGVPGVPDAVSGLGDGAGLVTGAPLEPAPAPPAPVADRKPVRLHAGIDPPRKVADRAPLYPAAARSAGVRGIVIIEATVDTQGAVVDTRVLRSVPMLDEAALSAVRQWRYEPARLNGAPTAVLITVTVNFTLGGM